MDFPDIPRSAGNGNSIGKDSYLNVKADQTVTGIFRGKIHTFEQHWDVHGIPCPGPSCERCEKGERKNFRFRINFITKGETGYVAKVFDNSRTTFETLKGVQDSLQAMNPKFKLESAVMEISRKGTGKNDTVYSFKPAKSWQLSPDTEAKIAAVALHELDPFADAQDGDDLPADEDGSSSFTEDDIPF